MSISKYQRRCTSGWPSAALIALVVCGCLLLLVPIASAANFTWQGGGSSTAWSNTGNWLGGTAPVASETIGTLTFPALPAFQNSENDLSSLSVNHLQVDDSHGYALTGQRLTLGSDGLSISAAEGSTGALSTTNPMTLGGSQTWDIAGPSTGFGQNVEVGGALSGEAAALTVNLSDPTLFIFGQRQIPGRPPDTAHDELGEVTINGTTTTVGDNSYGSLVNLNVASFNTSDGHALNLHDVELEDYETATGPIVATNSDLSLGGGASIGPVTASKSRLEPGEILSLSSLSLDSGSSLLPYIFVQGTTPGVDYDQIISTGTVALGGATLEPIGVGTNNGTECPAPPVGQVDTLISTTGSLTGTFGNAPNDSTVVTVCVPTERWYSYRINYNTSSSPETVTATALPAVPTFGEAPAISGSATEGQVLTAGHGYWTNNPTSYSYQWQRCNSGGTACQPISGTTAQSYTATAADVGSTIRVQETAANSEGASTPAFSEPTAVVQAAPAGGSGGGGNGSTTTSSGSTVGSTTSGSTGSSGGSATATISSAQIAALLGQQLIPSGKAAMIATLLKNGGLTMPFKALEAGTLVVQWYEVPSGAKLAKHSKAKPVLVASGQMSFPTAGTGQVKVRLTTVGKRLLKHAKQLKLTAKGIFTPRGQKPIDTTKQFSVAVPR